MKRAVMCAVAGAAVVPMVCLAAMEPGDILVLDQMPNNGNTPAAVMNVKPDGTIETLATDGLAPTASYSAMAVCPDGGVVLARTGNYKGGPTPTPFATGTPVPAGYYVESAVQRVSPDGAVSTLVVGGPLSSSNGQGYLTAVTCDSQGNVYVKHENYDPAPPAPPRAAVLKIDAAHSVTEFASGPPLDNPVPGYVPFDYGHMATDADDNIYLVQRAMPNVVPPTGVIPAKVFKIDPAGEVTTVAAATPHAAAPWFWSEPIDWVTGLGLDPLGNLIMEGEWAGGPTLHAANVLSLSQAGAFTTLLDVEAMDPVAFCLGQWGSYLATRPGDTTVGVPGRLFTIAEGDSLDVEILASSVEIAYPNAISYYPPEAAALAVSFDRDLFAAGEGIAMRFGLDRGRTGNRADLYFGVQYPASAGGALYLLNPNSAANGYPLLIDLATAQRYSAYVDRLRYGNGTMSIHGGGEIELMSFGAISGIPVGTYKLLGVMTASGANLFDSSRWLTPGGQPVEAEVFFAGTL